MEPHRELLRYCDATKPRYLSHLLRFGAIICSFREPVLSEGISMQCLPSSVSSVNINHSQLLKYLGLLLNRKQLRNNDLSRKLHSKIVF